VPLYGSRRAGLTLTSRRVLHRPTARAEQGSHWPLVLAPANIQQQVGVGKLRDCVTDPGSPSPHPTSSTERPFTDTAWVSSSSAAISNADGVFRKPSPTCISK
jgi:hypothetical protein